MCQAGPMASSVPEQAWLLLAAGDDRGHAGNFGYDDQHDAYYSWDSNVPNSKNLRVGDPVALWDKKRLLGVSVIEAIETARGSKVLHRCPVCSTTRISNRKRVEPRYRCMKCRHEFSSPFVDIVEVDTFRARYDAAWTPLDGLLNDGELRSFAVNPGEFNAMRRLDWAAFHAALSAKNALLALERVTARVDLNWHPDSESHAGSAQGFAHAIVRVRRGQRQFREHLLATQGSVCAFTGSAPERVLEAGHLYSYAQLGTHFQHGGLMLRRDIHRLFDDGSLAVDPSRLRVDVAPDLANFPQYARLDGERLAMRLRDEQVAWLSKHWEEHRLTSSARS